MHVPSLLVCVPVCTYMYMYATLSVYATCMQYWSVYVLVLYMLLLSVSCPAGVVSSSDVGGDRCSRWDAAADSSVVQGSERGSSFRCGRGGDWGHWPQRVVHSTELCLNVSNFTCSFVTLTNWFFQLRFWQKLMAQYIVYQLVVIVIYYVLCLF